MIPNIQKLEYIVDIIYNIIKLFDVGINRGEPIQNFKFPSKPNQERKKNPTQLRVDELFGFSSYLCILDVNM